MLVLEVHDTVLFNGGHACAYCAAQRKGTAVENKDGLQRMGYHRASLEMCFVNGDFRLLFIVT